MFSLNALKEKWSAKKSEKKRNKKPNLSTLKKNDQNDFLNILTKSNKFTPSVSTDKLQSKSKDSPAPSLKKDKKRKITEEVKQNKKMIKLDTKKDNDVIDQTDIIGDISVPSLTGDQTTKNKLTDDVTNQNDKMIVEPSYCSSYIDAISVTKDSLMVALYQNTKIYFRGNLWLKQVLGTSCISGFNIQENCEQPIFSPEMLSLMYIFASKGKKVKNMKAEELQKRSIPEHWIKDLAVSDDEKIVIIEVRRYTSTASNMTCQIDLRQHQNVDQLWYDNIGVTLVKDAGDLSLFNDEAEDWKEFIAEIDLSNTNKNTSIVITGGLGVGKSSFLRYVINNFLNYHKEVACLDLDPGQPELSMPSCISLSVLNKPLLGVASWHLDHVKTSWQKQVLLGDRSVNVLWMEYYKIVEHLVSLAATFNNVPLIVNTMGYTKKFGTNIIVDLLRMINPTNVVTIESSDKSKNFYFYLKPDFTSTTPRSNINCQKRLNYKLTVIPSLCFEKKSKSCNKILNFMRIMHSLSSLWKEQTINFDSSNLKAPVNVSWSSVGVHSMTTNQVDYNTLHGLRLTLVALCNVDNELLERDESMPDFPMWLNTSHWSWVQKSRVVQWGVISEVDFQSHQFRILTSLSVDQVLENVNLIIRPMSPDLPKKFFELLGVQHEIPFKYHQKYYKA